jgi:16S rRNA C967 or C1407 C5-methylase (RsmB/RsmF family)
MSSEPFLHPNSLSIRLFFRSDYLCNYGKWMKSRLRQNSKMEKETITKLNKTFEESAYEQDGVEYWLARELQELLGYAEWRNFSNAVEKAKESCKTSNEAVADHFVEVNKMIKISSCSERN